MYLSACLDDVYDNIVPQSYSTPDVFSAESTLACPNLAEGIPKTSKSQNYNENNL